MKTKSIRTHIKWMSNLTLVTCKSFNVQNMTWICFLWIYLLLLFNFCYSIQFFFFFFVKYLCVKMIVFMWLAFPRDMRQSIRNLVNSRQYFEKKKTEKKPNTKWKAKEEKVQKKKRMFISQRILEIQHISLNMFYSLIYCT